MPQPYNCARQEGKKIAGIPKTDDKRLVATVRRRGRLAGAIGVRTVNLVDRGRLQVGDIKSLLETMFDAEKSDHIGLMRPRLVMDTNLRHRA